MTQPWDFWHVAGGGGITLFNVREQRASAGVISGVDVLAPGLLSLRPFFVGDGGARVSKVSLALFSNTYVGTCRVGFYTCPPPSAHSMYPTTLIADVGEISFSGTTTPSVTFTPVDLAPGFHYIATLVNWPGPSLTLGSAYRQSVYGGPGYPLGYSSDGQPFLGFATPYAYGPLPATFPALPTGAFGFVVFSTSGVAFYIQSASGALTPAMTVTITYNAGTPAGTAVVSGVPSASSVTINYGNNTTPATVATALVNAGGFGSLIAVATPLGPATLMPNSGSQGRTLHPAGPLRGDLYGAPIMLPLTAIDVEP